MIKHFLQIGIELNTDKDPEPEIRVTPVDREVPKDIFDKVKEVVDFLDNFDPQPHDGEADLPVKQKIAIAKFFGHEQKVILEGAIFIRPITRDV